MPVARVIRHHWHGQNWLAWLISLKNYQHSLDSYIVCGFAGGRIAARCSVQIGRTGSDPAGISRPGSIPLEAILQTETAWGVPAAGEPAHLFLPANSAHQFVGIRVGIDSTTRKNLI